MSMTRNKRRKKTEPLEAALATEFQYFGSVAAVPFAAVAATPQKFGKFLMHSH